MRGNPDNPHVRAVSHDYLQTMGARLVSGRWFEPSDDAGAPPVIIVNRTVMRRLFNNEDPVGRLVHMDGYMEQPPQQIIGVVEDMRQSRLDAEPTPQMFIDYRQMLAMTQARKMPTAGQERLSFGFCLSSCAPIAISHADAGRAIARQSRRFTGIDACRWSSWSPRQLRSALLHNPARAVCRDRDRANCDRHPACSPMRLANAGDRHPDGARRGARRGAANGVAARNRAGDDRHRARPRRRGGLLRYLSGCFSTSRRSIRLPTRRWRSCLRRLLSLPRTSPRAAPRRSILWWP
jgi:hypothetical protein